MLFNLSVGNEINEETANFDIKEKAVSLMYISIKYLQDYANTLCNIRSSIQRKPFEWKTPESVLPASKLYMNLYDQEEQKSVQVREDTLDELTDEMKSFIKDFIVIRLDDVKNVYSPFASIFNMEGNVITDNLYMYLTSVNIPGFGAIDNNHFQIGGTVYTAEELLNNPNSIGIIIEMFLRSYSDEPIIFVINNKTNYEISEILSHNKKYFRNRFIGVILGIDE